MTDTTPKACPFCGGDKVLISQTLDQVGPNWFAACHRATCAFTGYSLTEAEALTAWNTRANADARLVEVIGILEGALKQIAESHWERFGLDQTDVEEVPNLSGDEAMEAARAALMDTAEPIQKVRAALSEVSHG